MKMLIELLALKTDHPHPLRRRSVSQKFSRKLSYVENRRMRIYALLLSAQSQKRMKDDADER